MPTPQWLSAGKEQDRRSFLLCKAVECFACNGKEGKRLQQFSKRYENTIKWWQGAYLFLLLTPEKNCSTVGMYHRFWCIERGSTNGSCTQDPTEFHAGASYILRQGHRNAAPVVLGSGRLLFQDIQESIRLTLGETQSFRSGVVLPGFLGG